jgi:class 3 adenylate cyclase/predicted ATPase
MTFEEILDQAIAMLQRRGRVTYGALKLQFHLDDDQLAVLKDELLYAQQVARDEDGRVLVWTGSAETPLAPPPHSTMYASHPPIQEVTLPQTAPRPVTPSSPEAERRQLTVMFCDLVDSTALASQLDPEDLRAVVQAYQETCAKVIARFEGHIAQYLGDGLLVYFGYPLAHEDNAQRAVRAGLGIVEALGHLNTRLVQERGVRLAVRLGIHTGLVVVGEIGSGGRQEQLALGETPNIAARLQSLAAPDTLIISEATAQLVQGYFVCQAFGAQVLKGLPQPLQVYWVLHESGAQTRLDVATVRGLTPLVGRDEEVALLQRCWGQATAGMGQVVLLSGEAGIGKSRLVQVLTEQVAAEPQAWLTACQCSPYHQHTAFYPMIDLLERVALCFDREESPPQRLRKLEGFLVQYGLPLMEAVPLLTALLSLPLPADYPPLTMSPEQQKQQTLYALLTLLRHMAAQQPVLFIMEDLHWVDPSTLEFLSLLVDQCPTARILALWTFRPDFSPPWTGRSHLAQVTVHRLPRRQAAEVIRQVAHGKTLPSEVVVQIVAKTDGVPLFVEELTKMVLESGLLQEQDDRYALTGPLPALAIPATLQDSLMARLDRLTTVKSLAQLGATLGHEFAYPLLQAVSPWDEATLQRGLHQLVEAEFLYQQGLPPQATYVFKHALIQDAAYQSLLRSTRQQYHQRIAQVLEAQFPEIVTTQPELLAHHYTEAGDQEHAVGYWQRAGERALQRSAYLEAVQHLTRGLQGLATLPHTLARDHQELGLQMPLGLALISTKGQAALEVEQTYARAQELCAHLGETPQLFQILRGLWRFYNGRGALPTGRKMAEQLLRLAQRAAAPALLLEAHGILGNTLFYLGDYAGALRHQQQGPAFTDPTMQRSYGLHHSVEAAAGSLAVTALTLWCLGYPTQAAQKSKEALAVARTLAHPYSLTVVQHWAAYLHHRRREPLAVQAQVDTLLPLATAQGFALYAGYGTCWQGWVWAMQGEGERGIAQLHQGMAAVTAAGQTLTRPLCLLLLAEAEGHGGQIAEGLRLLAEALTALGTSGRGDLLAEVYRLQGALLLRQSVPDVARAKACFQQALAIARRQQAKSWELRTAMSLARLWQQQGKRAEAHELLAPIYGWFTEGFDTADLQEAKVLLEELGG